MFQSVPPSNPFESPVSSTDSVDGNSSRRHGRLTPPFFVWLMVAGFVLTAGVVRWFTITGDHANVNVLTFLCGLLAFLTLGIWFLFFAGYSWKFRLSSAIAFVMAIVLFGILFRVEHVT